MINKHPSISYDYSIIPSNSVQIPTHMFSSFLKLDPNFHHFSPSKDVACGQDES